MVLGLWEHSDTLDAHRAVQEGHSTVQGQQIAVVSQQCWSAPSAPHMSLSQEDLLCTGSFAQGWGLSVMERNVSGGGMGPLVGAV